MAKALALFDFDHTLYRGDSMLDFTRYVLGSRRYYTGMLLLTPYLVLLKAGLMKNDKVKSKYLNRFFGGTEASLLTEKAVHFADVLQRSINPAVYKSFRQHLAAGDDVYIVSASCSLWLKSWCKVHNAGLIASELQAVDGRFTGSLEGSNCYGPEKANRILSQLRPDSYEAVYVYGKGRGDREMLRLQRPR